MPEDPRPPVAIRVTRPQTTEDEFLEQELETVTRTSVTLLGVQPRPQGVVLRFEVVLSSGHVVMRGEGRVVGFRPNAHQGLGGLTLRFTRLDSRTKALVDKATAVRERRRPSAAPIGYEPPLSTAPPVEDAVPPAAASSPDMIVDEPVLSVAPASLSAPAPAMVRSAAPRAMQTSRISSLAMS